MNGVKYIKTSVKDDINVEAAYKQLSDTIFYHSRSSKSDSFALKKQKLPESKKKGCC